MIVGIFIGMFLGVIDIYIPSSMLISMVCTNLPKEIGMGMLIGHNGVIGLGRIINHKGRADMLYFNEEDELEDRKEIGIGIGNYMVSKTLIIVGLGIFGSLSGIGMLMSETKDSESIWIISITMISTVLIPYVFIKSRDKVSTILILIIGLGISKYLIGNNTNPMIVMFIYLYSITGQFVLLRKSSKRQRSGEMDDDQGWAWFSGIVGSVLVSIPPTLLLSMHKGNRYRMGCTCTGVSEGISISMFILVGTSRDSLSTNIGRNELSKEQGVIILMILLSIMWMSYSLFINLYMKARKMNRKGLIGLSILMNYIGSFIYVSFIESIIIIVLSLIIHREIRRTGMRESSMGIIMLIPILGR